MSASHRAPQTEYDPGLQIMALAALFDRDFSIDWLLALGAAKASDILLVLENGIKRGVILQKSAGVYAFTRGHDRSLFDGAFSMEEKARLRKRIADMMLMEISDEQEMIKAAAAQLVHILNDVEGCRWLLRAGDLHRKVGQPISALRYYEKIFHDLGSVANEKADAMFIDAAIGYSKVTASSHEVEAVISVLHKALKRAEARGNLSQQSLLQMHLAKNEWVRSHYNAALRHFDRGWSLAKEINDPRLLRSVNVFSTFFPYWYGRFAEAVANYEQLVPEVDRYPEGRFPLLAGCTMGICYAMTGQFSQGLGMLKAIYNHCRQIGDEYNALMAKQGLGWIYLQIGRNGEALRKLEDVYGQRGETLGIVNEIWLLQTLAFAYYTNGDQNKSLGCLNAFLRLRNENSADIVILPDLIELCLAMEDGRYPRVEGLDLRHEIDRAMRSKNVLSKGLGARYLAIVQAREGLPAEEIIKTLRQAIEWLTESGHPLGLARAMLELGRQLLRMGNEPEANDAIRAATRTLAPINEELIPGDLRFLVRDLRSKENLLDEVLRAGRELATIGDADALSQCIISTVNRITGAQRGAIFLLDGSAGSRRVSLKAAKNLVTSEINQPEFAQSKKIVIEVLEHGKGRIWEMDAMPGQTPIYGDAIRSCICAPIKIRNKVIGALYHDNRFPLSSFPESDLELLDFFASLAALAIDNAQAYQKIERMNRLLAAEIQYGGEPHPKKLAHKDTVGQSTAFVKTLKLVESVASTETTVLLLGETGVGKEIIARAIHGQSSRNEGPFICVNCSALSENIIASELFGHEKGSFTGALKQRLGRFELADRGTLFLDEIGDIPLDIQVKLLRVLQLREFERVGGGKTIRSDFRLIAATNKDLARAVKDNKFRQDLYYRINVFPIRVPPLRERKDDIPLLAEHFLKKFNVRASKPVGSIPEREMEKLINYDWPGNVRELENAIERGTLLSKGGRFRAPELEAVAREPSTPHEILSLDENERRMILMALEKAGGKIGGRGGAAELLDINRNTLHSRMKRLNITKTKISWGIE